MTGNEDKINETGTVTEAVIKVDHLATADVLNFMISVRWVLRYFSVDQSDGLSHPAVNVRAQAFSELRNSGKQLRVQQLLRDTAVQITEARALLITAG